MRNIFFLIKKLLDYIERVVWDSFSGNNLLGEDSPVVRLAFCDEDQPIGVILDSEASATNEAPTDEDTPPWLGVRWWIALYLHGGKKDLSSA